MILRPSHFLPACRFPGSNSAPIRRGKEGRDFYAQRIGQIDPEGLLPGVGLRWGRTVRPSLCLCLFLRIAMQRFVILLQGVGFLSGHTAYALGGQQHGHRQPTWGQSGCLPRFVCSTLSMFPLTKQLFISVTARSYPTTWTSPVAG